MKSRHFQPEERLAILRAVDRFLTWGSLDDPRLCILCDRRFTERQIEITSRHGGYDLYCPTEGCKSLPHQWVHPGKPVLSKTAYADWWRAIGDDTKRASVTPMYTVFSRA